MEVLQELMACIGVPHRIVIGQSTLFVHVHEQP